VDNSTIDKAGTPLALPGADGQAVIVLSKLTIRKREVLMKTLFKLSEVQHPYVRGSKTKRPYVVGYGCDVRRDY
jgi:hypothetical protein